ncbi:MAG: ATP-dependent zinc metalloprotease FtsH [Patescibacteria group bacterium]
MPDIRRTTIIVIVAGLLGFYLLSTQSCQSQPTVQIIDYSEFKQLVKEKKVEQVAIDDKKDIIAKLKDEKIITTQHSLNDPDLFKLLDENGVKYSIIKEQESNSDKWIGRIISLLPLALIFIFFILMMKGMANQGSGRMEFTKHKARLISADVEKITFADVAGCEEAKDEVREVVAFLKDPVRFSRLGAKLPKGVMLVGFPGTGKTLLAKAVAGEAGVPFYSISGSEFVEVFVGVGAARVRDLFEQGKKNAPCIIFIDEIDAIGRQRGTGMGGGHDEREQALNQLLVEMDGFSANSGVIMMAATNRPDILDPALTRPGRFDRMIPVLPADIKGREAILRVHVRKIKLSPTVDLALFAKMTPGASGADLANIINEAALIATRREAEEVTTDDFVAAMERVVMGLERKGAIMSAEEKNIIAIHEAGHAIVGHHTGSHVAHVTIIPRGTALGITMAVPSEKGIRTKKDLLADILAAYGGRAAEKIKLNIQTTGASNDIERATKIAQDMVAKYGMSDLGPRSYGHKTEYPFFGKQLDSAGPSGGETANLVDREINKILNECYAQAETIIKDNFALFEEFVALLLEKETIRIDELNALFQKYQNGSTP